MEIFLYRCYIYIYINKYINIINIIYILYMTALLLTFAVCRLFNCFPFQVFFFLQDARFPFASPLPLCISCLLRTFGPRCCFIFSFLFAVRFNVLKKVVRMMLINGLCFAFGLDSCQVVGLASCRVVS